MIEYKSENGLVIKLMSKQIRDLRSENIGLWEIINKSKNIQSNVRYIELQSSFWKRLYFLFTGV